MPAIPRSQSKKQSQQMQMYGQTIQNYIRDIEEKEEKEEKEETEGKEESKEETGKVYNINGRTFYMTNEGKFFYFD
jgi:hypothetical protein